MLNSTSLSDLTDDVEMNYDPFYLNQIPNTVTVSTKLNFKTGRAAHVARTLLHESDLLQAREENKRKAKQGKEIREKLEKAKKLTAMLNFKTFGCKIGEDSLRVRLKMKQKKMRKKRESFKRRMIFF